MSNQMMHQLKIRFSNNTEIIVLTFLFLLLTMCREKKEEGVIMTVNGPVNSSELGISLTHEHILVDFIGADSISESRWDKAEVVRIAAPFVREIKALGCKSFFECTPSYLGKDPLILKALSDETGMNFITNTGYYGAGPDNRYIPGHAYSESAEQLSARWLKEWNEGIDGTGIKPGFIKIAVAGESVSDLHEKLVRAAAMTHLGSGLSIASHTGPANLAYRELEILKEEGVAPDAFIWVHAANEKDIQKLVEAAKEGVWISIDKLNEKNVPEVALIIKTLKESGVLDRVLVSHDAGWYDPARENGGNFRGFTTLFEKLLPALRKEQFTDEDINALLVSNPARAFEISIRKI